MAAIIPKIRAGNQFTYLWAIERAGVAVDLTTATDIELSYGVGKPCADYSKIPFTVVDGNKISSSHLYGVTGTYNLKLEFKIDGEQSTIDIDAFKIVPRSEDASESSQFAVTSDMAIGFKGDKLTFADLTTSDIAELQQPANDAIASIQAVEVDILNNENNRVDAEHDRNQEEINRQGQEVARQANTGTAIQNAQTATTNANTATTSANNAATLANTKAGLADAAATNANAIANSKPTIFEGYANLPAGVETLISGTSFTPVLNLRPVNIQVFYDGMLKNVAARYVVNGDNYDIYLTSTVDLFGAEITLLGSLLNQPPAILRDGSNYAWFKTDPNYVTKDSANLSSIWWDKNVALGTLGVEQSSGVILAAAVYKITATQTDFFYTGCAVGDTFICSTVKTCDVNNKVCKYLGNHLTQSLAKISATNRFNPIFTPDGMLFYYNNAAIKGWMRTALFGLSRPMMIYMLVRQKNWSSTKCLMDGISGDMQLSQRTTSPNINLNGGIANNANMDINQFSVVRITLTATSSSIQVDRTAKATGTAVSDPGGIVFGSNRSMAAYFSNMQIKEAIFRPITTADDEEVIYQYLDKQNKLLSKWDAKTWNSVGTSITAAGLYQPLVTPQLGLTAINAGVGGATIAKTAVGTQNISIVQRVCGLDGVTAIGDADLWTIEGGVNDAASNIQVPLGTVADSGFDPTTFYGAYQMIIENILARPNSPKLALFTPLHSSRDGALLDSYMTAIKALGARYNVPVCDLYNISGITSANLATYTSDLIHPTQLGTEIYFGKIVDAIKWISPS